MPTFSELRETFQRRKIAESDRVTRVKVFNMNGIKIGLAGLGQGDDQLTFPARYPVGDALNGQIWIRKASQQELADDPQWWIFSETQPTDLIHANGSLAFRDDPIGLLGTTLTAIVTTKPKPIDCQGQPTACLDGICTPPTPPSYSQ